MEPVCEDFVYFALLVWSMLEEPSCCLSVFRVYDQYVFVVGVVHTWRQDGSLSLFAILSCVFQRRTLRQQWPAGTVEVERVVAA